MSNISFPLSTSTALYGAEVGLAFDLRGGGDADESRYGLALPAEIPSPIAARFLGWSPAV